MLRYRAIPVAFWKRSRTLRVVSRAERGVLMKCFLGQHSWSNDYLRAVADRESFDPDVSRFSVEVTSRHARRPR